MPNRAYPGPTMAECAVMPVELTQRAQWVLWRGEWSAASDGVARLSKVPMDAHTLTHASSTDPQTWATHQACVAALPVALEGWEREGNPAYGGGGIGYVLDSDDPFVGLDLDHCVDPVTGALAPWAMAILHAIQSYAEITPSGTGLRLFAAATLPPRGRKQGNLEMYTSGRFLTVTGWHVPASPGHVESRQVAVTALWCRTFGCAVGDAVHCVDEHGVISNPAPWVVLRIETAPDGALYAQFAESTSGWPLVQCERAQPVSAATPARFPDEEVVRRAIGATNGDKVRQLAGGDWQGYDSQSTADCAFCVQLAFWTQDPAQLDRLFRASGLMRPKWDEQRGSLTYGARTIRAALDLQTTHYQGGSVPPLPASSSLWSHGGLVSTAASSAAAPLPWSDYVNALHLVRQHGASLRYCHPWKRWLVWTGSHWRHDTTGAVMRNAKDTVKQLAQKVPTLADAEAKALLRHIKDSFSTSKLRAMIDSAQSEPGIPVQPDDLDTHIYALNYANGTVDLRTGTLQPHRRADLLTKCLPLAYDPAARCPTWERFLWHIMGGTMTPDTPTMSMGELDARHTADDRARRLVAFLQRAIGYSLTGSTAEQCLFVLHGSGANGKSTLLDLLQVLLGDYAQATPSASLLARDRYDGIPNDIARLRGARLVTAVEIGEGKSLNEELVKRLTGQDTLTARFLHAEFFDFKGEFKLYIACNHLPRIRGTDHAIWRRVKLIPFDVTIPADQQNTTMPAQLRAELPGICAWAVQGCLDWQQHGLQTPAEVTAATSRYRSSMDVIGSFLQECCVVNPSMQAKAGALYDAYKSWCEASGEYAVSKKALGTSLDERGFTTYTSNGVWRLGIGIV